MAALINIIDTNKSLISYLKNEFKFTSVAVQEDNIFNHTADAVVSPANSFGFMDGGLDGKLRDFFGQSIEDKVRKKIAADFQGELLVGQTTIIETDTKAFPLLIIAPTMRVPSNVSESLNAYLAMRAILNAVIEHQEINSIIIPGLCSLSGAMPPHIVARQMRAAYDYVIEGQHRFSHWRLEKDFENYLRCRSDTVPRE